MAWLGRWLGRWLGGWLGATGEPREAFVHSLLEAEEDPSVVTVGGVDPVLTVVDEEGEIMAFTIKEGATHRVLRRQVRHNGNAVDLTDATVLLRLKPPGSASEVIEHEVEVEDGDDGWIRYEMVAEDTAAGAGTYRAELLVTYPDDTVEVAPSATYFEIVVKARLS